MTDPGMDALQRLIRARMQDLHLSYSEVARRGGLPRSTVHHLATHGGRGRLPKPLTLEHLATGLDLPLEVVRAAAASAAGFALASQPSGDQEIEVLVASLSRLSRSDREHVAVLVRSLLAAADSSSEGGKAKNRRPTPSA